MTNNVDLSQVRWVVGKYDEREIETSMYSSVRSRLNVSGISLRSLKSMLNLCKRSPTVVGVAAQADLLKGYSMDQERERLQSLHSVDCLSLILGAGFVSSRQFCHKYSRAKGL